jgi:hypothetical protein
MDPQIANKHRSAVLLIREIIICVRKNQKTISKAQLIDLLAEHLETEEYLNYTQNILLVNCRDNDILTIDGQTNNVRFPKRRDGTGNVIEYHYIK